MKFIGNMVVYFGLFILFQGSLGNRSEFTMSGLLMSAAIAVPFLLIGSSIIGSGAATEQEGKDGVAGRIVADGGAGHRYFLYLRPFDSTNAFSISDAHRNAFAMELYRRDGFDDIERVISEALEPTAPFIALGRPGEHRGAGRGLTTEDAWRDTIRHLAQNAMMIIILPSYREGTLYELELLVTRRWLGKTLFVMPPSDGLWYSAGATDVAKEWKLTQEACAKFGLTLPDAIPGGALFRIKEATGAPLLSPLPHSIPGDWSKALQNLIAK
jgi:hypothetical protein